MSINLDNATILMTAAYIQNASEAFGHEGANSLRLLLDSIRLVLAARPPELITAPLTILVPVGGQDADATASNHGQYLSQADPVAVADYLSQYPTEECLIVIAADRTFRVVTPAAPTDHTVLAASAVVYHRRNGVEWMAAGTSNVPVLRLSSISVSAFADPTISSLDEALDHYGKRVRESACEILRPVWEGGADGPRLVLVNKPEHHMRESLFQALSMMLRRADVTREHMVNASKPVDIRVSWTGSPAEALVEIKWLGRSLTASGSKSPYTDYATPRAQSGANQLAKYLDLKKTASAKQSVVGYLVMYDARRGNVQGPYDKLPAADALAFEHQEVSFKPDHSTLRPDFTKPRRWFMRPTESDFLEAA